MYDASVAEVEDVADSVTTCAPLVFGADTEPSRVAVSASTEAADELGADADTVTKLPSDRTEEETPWALLGRLLNSVDDWPTD